MHLDCKQCFKSFVLIITVFCVVFLFGYLPSIHKSENVIHAPAPLIWRHKLTIQINPGRLGNQMFTYATLFGLGALNNRQIMVMPENYDVLKEYFDIQCQLVYNDTFKESNPWPIGNWLTSRDHTIPPDSNIITGNAYPTSYTFFHHVRKELRDTFLFRPPVREHAQSVLRRVKQLRPWTQVFVGVHVRRGDYIKKSSPGWLRAFDGREVDKEFFRRAVNHFKKRYANITFLAVSDDRDWCRKKLSKLGILTTPDSPSAGHDLALLSECNHTIMTYGTFGFWGGYLSGGEVVYFDDFLKPNTSMTLTYFVYDKMYPEDWVGISTTEPGYWESYTNPFLE